MIKREVKSSKPNTFPLPNRMLPKLIFFLPLIFFDLFFWNSFVLKFNLTLINSFIVEHKKKLNPSLRKYFLFFNYRKCRYFLVSKINMKNHKSNIV